MIELRVMFESLKNGLYQDMDRFQILLTDFLRSPSIVAFEALAVPLGPPRISDARAALTGTAEKCLCIYPIYLEALFCHRLNSSCVGLYPLTSHSLTLCHP